MVLLIADMEIDEARRARHLLPWEEFGFEEVYTAYSQEKADQIVKNNSPDLIICNIDFVTNTENIWLNQYKEMHPWAEVVITGKKLEKENFRPLLHLGTLDYLEKPIQKEEMENILQLYKKKIQIKNDIEMDIQSGRYWRQNYALVQELFWKNLCLNRLQGGPEAIEESAVRFNVDLDKDSYYKMIMVSMKNQDEMWSVWGENLCQTAIQNIACAVIKPPEDRSKVIVIYNRVVILIEQDEFEKVELRCNDLIQRCSEELKAEVLCYISEPAFCEQIPDVYNNLLTYSRDDVLKQQRIIRVKNRKKEDLGEIVIPKTWEDILYTSNPMKLVAEVKSFLIALAHKNQLNEENFRIFQQDMLQLFFTYMEKKELSAHELYDNKEIFKLYKAAILSIDRMCQWVQTCTEYITHRNFWKAEDPNERMVAMVKNYVSSHLKEKITVGQIAEVIHLSPDYMTRVFKQKTGVTLKEYLLENRMKEAKNLLRTTKDTVSNIAAELGYDNLSYFIRQFQKYYGVTPKQYQKQKTEKQQ